MSLPTAMTSCSSISRLQQCLLLRNVRPRTISLLTVRYNSSNGTPSTRRPGRRSGLTIEPPILLPRVPAEWRAEPTGDNLEPDLVLDPFPIPHKGRPPYTLLSDAYAQRYLRKLHERNWFIWIAPLPDSPGDTVLALRKEIPFDRPDDTANFARELLQRMMQEKNEGFLQLNDLALSFTTWTRTAIALTPSFQYRDSTCQPGITIADVRMAFIVESLWEDYFKTLRRPFPEKRLPPSHIRGVQSIDDYLKPRKGQIINGQLERHRCMACGGAHSLDLCPHRTKIKPPYGCKRCGLDHWTIDCPRSPPKCSACGQAHDIRNCPTRQDFEPPHACRQCGGDHWIYDCPKPPICLACGGRHHIRDCSVRHTIKAPPCGVCGENHWRIDCPGINRTCRACGCDHNLSECPDRRRIPPPHPCTKCGGNHWTMDCDPHVKCLACGGHHHIKDCPDRQHIPPVMSCKRCGSTDHWYDDCPTPRPCPACGKAHSLGECPSRRDIPVRHPCPNCGGMHWAVDCLEKPNCPACGEKHTLHKCTRRAEFPPSTPCPICQGNHWTVDCPQNKAVPGGTPHAHVPGVDDFIDSLVQLARNRNSPP